MRRTRVVLFAALAVGAAVGLAGPVVGAHAAPGGPMTAAGGEWTGTSGDDVLVIGHDADLFTHNRFAAGDPGFESSTDFDSTTPGVQTKGTGGSSDFIFNFGAGDDTLSFVGEIPAPLRIHGADFGAGFDTLDLTNYSTGPAQGAYVGSPRLPGIDKVIGTPYDDVLEPKFGEDTAGVTLLGGDGHDVLKGTAGNDVLDGGAGESELEGRLGDDLLTVQAPLPGLIRTVAPGEGDDTLVVRGAEAADDLEVVPDINWQTTIQEAGKPDGGYRTLSEHLAFDLGGGDDSLYVEPRPGGLVVDGGAGNDSLNVNALQGTAGVSDDGGDRVYTLPAGRYRQPSTIRVRPGFESRAIFNETVLATSPGAGGGPHVRTFRLDGAPVASFFAYDPAFTGGVNVALGDLDGDIDDEIITGAGPGGGPHVRVFHSDGTDTGVGFFAYGADFHGGVNVAAIDLDGDGVAEIVTTPAQGGGPHVRIWSGDGELLDEWFADGFGTTGLHVATGQNFNAVGGDNIILSAAAGPSLARVFNPDGNADERFDEFVPYPSFGGGAAVVRADIGAGGQRPLDGIYDQMVSAAGPGGGPHVRVVSPDSSGGYVELGSFFAYDPNFHGGVDVTTCNPDGVDDEVVTAAGAGGGPHVRMFRKDGTPAPLSFFAYDPNFHGGVHVACGGAETKSY